MKNTESATKTVVIKISVRTIWLNVVAALVMLAGALFAGLKLGGFEIQKTSRQIAEYAITNAIKGKTLEELNAEVKEIDRAHEILSKTKPLGRLAVVEADINEVRAQLTGQLHTDVSDGTLRLFFGKPFKSGREWMIILLADGTMQRVHLKPDGTTLDSWYSANWQK
jgi:hypothetical protein